MQSSITRSDRKTRFRPIHRLSTAGRFCAAGLLLGCALPVQAGIVEIDRTVFDALASEGSLYVEDFESMTPGLQSSPLALSNAVQFDADAPFVVQAGGGQLLTDNSLTLTAVRIFSGFAMEASLFGVDLLLDDSDEYSVTARTVNGDSLELTAQRGNAFDGFFGLRLLQDSLLDVSFSVVGGPSGPGSDGAGISNYYFDNLAVDAVSVEEPVEFLHGREDPAVY